MTINKMPDKYWLYPFAVLSIISMISYLPEGIVFSAEMGIISSAIITGYIFIIYTLWVGESTFYKIIAVLFSGIFMVLVVMIIQAGYERMLLRKATAAE